MSTFVDALGRQGFLDDSISLGSSLVGDYPPTCWGILKTLWIKLLVVEGIFAAKNALKGTQKHHTLNLCQW
jgi:hypothetical protein